MGRVLLLVGRVVTWHHAQWPAMLSDQKTLREDYGMAHGPWGVSPAIIADAPEGLPIALVHIPLGIALAYFPHGSLAMRAADALADQFGDLFDGDVRERREEFSAAVPMIGQIVQSHRGIIG